jgi:N-acetyl-beta-hexosaminidase
MQNLNYKSRYIRNFLPQTENSKNYIKKLKAITFSVWSKFDEVNGKYSEMINDATRRIDNQIKINTSKNKNREFKNIYFAIKAYTWRMS